MRTRKYISTVLFLSLVTATFTPITQCVNPELISRIAKTTGYVTVGVGSKIVGAIMLLASGINFKNCFIRNNRFPAKVSLLRGLIYGCGSLCCFYTSYHMFKNAYNSIK